MMQMCPCCGEPIVDDDACFSEKVEARVSHYDTYHLKNVPERSQ
jgi:hypothetical protein